MATITVEEKAPSYAELKFENERLSDIRARYILRQRECDDKEERIKELADHVHDLMVEVYLRDEYIDKINAALSDRAEDARATISRMKARSMFTLTMQDIYKLRSVSAFAESTDKFVLKFDANGRFTGTFIEK